MVPLSLGRQKTIEHEVNEHKTEKKEEQMRMTDGHTSYKKHPLEAAMYWRVDDLAALMRRNRSKIYQMVKDGLLPKPMRLTPSYSVWKKTEVLEALRKLEEAAQADA